MNLQNSTESPQQLLTNKEIDSYHSTHLPPLLAHLSEYKQERGVKEKNDQERVKYKAISQHTYTYMHGVLKSDGQVYVSIMRRAYEHIHTVW